MNQYNTEYLNCQHMDYKIINKILEDFISKSDWIFGFSDYIHAFFEKGYSKKNIALIIKIPNKIFDICIVDMTKEEFMKIYNKYLKLKAFL